MVFRTTKGRAKVTVKSSKRNNKAAKPGMHRTTFDIPKSLWEELKDEAERRHLAGASALLRQILQERYFSTEQNRWQSQDDGALICHGRTFSVLVRNTRVQLLRHGYAAFSAEYDSEQGALDNANVLVDALEQAEDRR